MADQGTPIGYVVQTILKDNLVKGNRYSYKYEGKNVEGQFNGYNDEGMAMFINNRIAETGERIQKEYILSDGEFTVLRPRPATMPSLNRGGKHRKTKKTKGIKKRKRPKTKKNKRRIRK